MYIAVPVSCERVMELSVEAMKTVEVLGWAWVNGLMRVKENHAGPPKSFFDSFKDIKIR